MMMEDKKKMEEVIFIDTETLTEEEMLGVDEDEEE